MHAPARLAATKAMVIIAVALLMPWICLAQVSNCNLICNSDFENIQVSAPGTYHLVPQGSSVPCWQTTEADGLIEVWGTGFNGVPAYSGNQFVELNANVVATLFQTFTAIPGTSVTIAWAHRGRLGPDVMSVSIGPLAGPYDTLGSFTADNTGWVYTTVPYTFPTGLGNTFVLQFNSISATGGNPAIGNFLDAISITLPIPAVTLTATNACSNVNNGTVTAITTGGNPPYTYAWSPAVTGTDTITNLSPNQYILTITDADGCTASNTATVAANPVPVSTANPVICANGSYTLPDGTTAAITGTYTTHVPNANGCDSIVTTNLTVNPVPLVTLTASICFGSTYLLPNGTAVNTGGTYIDTLNTALGCDSIISTTLTIIPPPVTPVNAVICYGTSYMLPGGTVVNQSGTYLDTLVTTGGCDSVVITTLTITPPPVTTQSDSICPGQTFTRPSGLTTSTAGIYFDTLVVTGGCDSVVITHLTVNPVSATTVYDTICSGLTFTLQNGNAVSTAGSYPVTLSNHYGCDSVVTTLLTVINLNAQAQSTNVLCFGQSTGTVTATCTGGVLPYTFNLLAGATVATNATGAFNTLAAGNYTVHVSDNFGCSATAAVAVNQLPALSATDSAVNVTCYNYRNGQVILNATGGKPGYNFTLGNQTGSTGRFTGLDAGTYPYLVTDYNNCPDSGTISITQPAPITIGIQPDSLYMYLGKSLQLSTSSNFDPNAAYYWTPPTGLSCIACPNPVVTITTTTGYNLSVTATINGNTCTADTNITVTVIPDYDIFIPNAITPNGDGVNDNFQIYGNLSAIKYLAIQIYDRLGEKLFESNDPYFKWDTTYKGKPLNPQVLVYVIRAVFEDNHTDKLFKGTVTLLR